jgi:hypothetical protein
MKHKLKRKWVCIGPNLNPVCFTVANTKKESIGIWIDQSQVSWATWHIKHG